MLLPANRSLPSVRHTPRESAPSWQPIAKMPKAGDSIVVRTRNSPRRNATATILNVGFEMQPVASPMNGYTNSLDRAVPFIVSVPDSLALLPGEIVDLVLR